LNWEVEVWPDIGYIARFNFRRSGEDQGCHWVDFEVYEITSYPGYPEEHQDSPASEFSVARKDWKRSGDDVGGDELDEARVLAKGNIKFDGCSHWYWHEYVHICGIDEAAKHCAMVYRVFLKVKEEMAKTHDWLWKEWEPNA
jgi:hypothetical protein